MLNAILLSTQTHAHIHSTEPHLYLSSKLDIIAISFTQNTSTNHFLSLCHVVGIANSSITSDSAGTNAGFCRINFQWVLLFRKDTLHSPPLAISWGPWFSLGKT